MCLSKIVESSVNNELNLFLWSAFVLSSHHSGFGGNTAPLPSVLVLLPANGPRNYLSKREECVVMRLFCVFTPVKRWVPQGLGSGPVHCSCPQNNIFYKTSSHLFADDTWIVFHSVTQNLQQAPDKLHLSLLDLNLVLNSSESKYTPFSRGRDIADGGLHIKQT